MRLAISAVGVSVTGHTQHQGRGALKPPSDAARLDTGVFRKATNSRLPNRIIFALIRKAPRMDTNPSSARWARIALMSCVRWRINRSRVRCSISAACCSAVFAGTNRIDGRVTDGTSMPGTGAVHLIKSNADQSLTSWKDSAFK